MIPVAIVGETGKGKSTSLYKNEKFGIQGLDPKDTYYINVSGKPLPFKGGDKIFPDRGLIPDGRRQSKVSTVSEIKKILEKIVKEYSGTIKNVVIDDSQYLQSFYFMEKAKEKGFDKFVEIGLIGYEVIKFCLDNSKSKIKVFFMYHEEETNTGKRKIKTSGKLVDQHMTLEGLFTIVLFCETNLNSDGNLDYGFATQTDGYTTAKSPIDMFETRLIKNDLGLVAKAIDDYYG